MCFALDIVEFGFAILDPPIRTVRRGWRKIRVLGWSMHFVGSIWTSSFVVVVLVYTCATALSAGPVRKKPLETRLSVGNAHH